MRRSRSQSGHLVRLAARDSEFALFAGDWNGELFLTSGNESWDVPIVAGRLGSPRPAGIPAALGPDDVAIAGDDEPVPMLAREWAAAAARAADPQSFLSILAGVLAPAQSRSSGLVLSAFEGARADPELAGVAAQMSAQRVTMATWTVARLTALGALRAEVGEDEAVDTGFPIMEPAVFDRLTRQRGWTLARYQDWIARSLRRLLVADAGHGQRSLLRGGTGAT